MATGRSSFVYLSMLNMHGGSFFQTWDHTTVVQKLGQNEWPTTSGIFFMKPTHFYNFNMLHFDALSLKNGIVRVWAIRKL